MIKLNGRELKPTIFPDGTSQVIGLQNHMATLVKIEFEFEKEREIMQLFQVLDYCEHAFSTHGFTPQVELHMPFLPYGRQDKVLSGDYFAKGTFTRMLTKFSCLKKVYTLDVHSSNVDYVGIRDIQPIKEINKALIAVNPDIICYPDRGAKQRYSKIPTLEDFESCSMDKNRDQKTGHIERMYLNELVDLKGKVVLLIDDICDRGGTFMMAAEKLRACGANEVHLYTTHGIYSGGKDLIFDNGIDRIFNRKGEVFRDGE